MNSAYAFEFQMKGVASHKLRPSLHFSYPVASVLGSVWGESVVTVYLWPVYNKTLQKVFFVHYNAFTMPYGKCSRIKIAEGTVSSIRPVLHHLIYSHLTN